MQVPASARRLRAKKFKNRHRIPLISSYMFGRARPFRLLVGTAVGLLFVAVQASWGLPPDSTPMASRVLTNIFEIWSIPPAEKQQAHRLKTEAVIYFYGPEWSCAWGECAGRPTWLPICDSHMSLKAGQRIAIDAVLQPGQDHFDWSQSRLRVLEEGVELKPETVPSLSEKPKELDKHLVQVEGFITHKTEESRRVTFNIQTLGITATVRFLKDTNESNSFLEPGDRVRVKAVYALNFDKNGNVSEFNLWVARSQDIQTLQKGDGRVAEAEPQVVLTNIYQIWTMPLAEKQQPHRIRTEVVIYSFDPEWQNAWGECQGETAYLPIADCPVPLKASQRVAIDGVIVPIRERFVWDKTQVRILEDAVPLKGEIVPNLDVNPKELKGHLIVVEGLIDRLLEDATHVTLTFLAGDTVAKAYVVKDRNNPSLNFKAGDFVRLKCVYSPQFDINGKISDLSLFLPQLGDVQVVGSIGTDRRFNAPITSTGDIREETPTNDLIHVEGTVYSHEPGKGLTLWDDTEQVMVQSMQTQPLRFGDHVEAIGYAYVAGVQRCLRGGLYRLSVATNREAPALISGSERSPLRLAERIRDMNREDVKRNFRANIRGIVTWAHPETRFAYVQDASGGIRVADPKWGEQEARKSGTIVTVRGEVCAGDFVPVITNAIISRVGFWNLEEGPFVTLEQALTGVEDGRWVQMRGFVRQVIQLNGLVRFNLTTSSGEFEAWTPATQSFESWQGSIVRVHGVCAAVANARHQLTGIQIWVPEVKYLQVEEPAPDDLFAVPVRSLDSLRRFNAQTALNQRVRTFGTVVLHVPGRYLYVQAGRDSVLALSQKPELLHPGDRVEVVGFPGNEGRRFLLREAVYRLVSSGSEPLPVQLPAAHSVNPDLEGLLAQAEGVLLNTVNKESEARLLIRTANSAFEASLSSTAADAGKHLKALEFGSRLAVAGVYQVQSDEYGNPRSFILRLRSWDDIRVLNQPPWWTLTRLLWVLLAALAVSLVALYWGIVLSRKNTLLRQAQAELQAAHDKLELRVQERTCELQDRTNQLQEQVIAKERAREELAEAQKRLMLASRHAGMAEVATGVLHNVGNVLNSVNISVSLMRDKLAPSSNLNMDRVLALLQEHRNDLAQFLSADAKGKKLLEYLEILNRHWLDERKQVVEELSTLTQNVEHIKEIVAMQQSYARASGVSEVLDPAELVEDAIRMHAAAFERHAVKVIRQFEKVPAINVDRHKALQVLTNLLHNAKYACEEKSSDDRKVTVRLGIVKPDRIGIEVADNGVGIPAENLTRIFSFGFTTRRNGHGFGLHSGALAAKEMGGSLSVRSGGLGEGATFVLELPANCRSGSNRTG